jgi:hypothetical protein
MACASAPTLAHRWSFSGNYEDSVGGSVAATIGSSVGFNASNTAVVMSGDGNSKGSLNLGTGMLPADAEEVTVEIWATQTAVKNWARIIDYGPDNKNYFIAAWNNGTNTERDQVKVAKGDAALMTADGTLCPFTLNTAYHFSFTFRANLDGSTDIRWWRRNAATGTVENFGHGYVPNWNLGDLATGKLYIGHSQYSSDADANAIYDEVRVWRGCLTDEQLTASALAGPDTLPDIVGTPDSALKRSTWTGTVDADATNAGNWTPAAPDADTLAVFAGGFAAQIPSGSSFACAGIVFEDARLTADCDWRGLAAKIRGGTLDLAGNKLHVSQLDGSGAIISTSLPAEYQPVEYIESNGAQWLNTGFTPACMDRMEMKLSFVNKTGTQCLWCSRGTTITSSTFSGFMIDGDKLRFDRNANAGGGNMLSPVAGDVSTVVADGSTLQCTLNGADAGKMAGGGFTPASPVVLFASHTSGGNLTFATEVSNWASYRLYGFRVFDGKGGLKCDLVPVRRVSDGKLGVYDRIGGTFAANMTDVPFEAGADLVAAAVSAVGELHVEAPNGVAVENSGVAVSGSVKLVKEGSGRLTFKAKMNSVAPATFVAGTLDIADNRVVVSGLDGNGTITTSSAANLIDNPGFEENPPADGGRVCRSPAGWNYSGTVYVQKNNKDYGGSQRNGSVWCFVNSGSNISQNFRVAREGTFKVSINVATRNNMTTQWKSDGNVKIDGTTVISWTGQNNLTATRTGTIVLKPGVHTITLACTSNSGTQFDNVSVVGASGVLDVNVPEGVTSDNRNVSITGGGAMQVWKTGKGRLVMSKANTGFGSGGRRGWSMSMVVKEGVVRQSSSIGTASCGAQYSAIKVEDGAQFDLAGRIYHDYDYDIAGSGPDGAGALVNSGTVSSPWATDGSKRGYLQDVRLSGDAVLGGPEAWALLFYNNASEHTVNMNGHVLSIRDVMLYSVSINYSGSGKIVIEEDACMEIYRNSQSAPDCDVVVDGVLQIHDKALSPVKSLKFGVDGKFNNTWETRPLFVVNEEYAPPLTVLANPQTVQLGSADHLKTTLDLSLFSAPFDARSTMFYAGSEVTVDLGERVFAEDTLLVSWNAIPTVGGFFGAGVAVDAKSVALAVRADGLWAVCLKPERPATARWSGAGEVANLLDPANWNCWNVAGELLDGKVPEDFTVLIVDGGTTTLTVPEGATPTWGRVQFCDDGPKMTQWGRIFYGADRSAFGNTSFLSTALGEYTALGRGDLANLNGQNTGWQYSWLDWATLRFDGWFKVTSAQAGVWRVRQKFDDHFGFAIDGEWVLANNTHSAEKIVECDVAEGWHRFTIICGDTNGGQGASVSLAGVNVPMTISVNGGAERTFSADVFEMGTERTVIKLGCDCDWRALGRVALASGAAIDLNGHVLKTVGVVCDDYIGAAVTNSADVAGELWIEVQEGGTFNLEGVTLQGDVKLVKTGAGTLVPKTVGQRFTGGIVVAEGTMKSEHNGSKLTLGTINLLKNWNFDEGALGSNSGNWSYANGGNGFELPGWRSSNEGRVGLSKASDTWVASGRGVGKYALFMQTNKNSVDLSQDIVLKTPGMYYYYFQYAGRPKYTGATTELRLIRNGTSKRLASVTTSADTYSVCEGFVEVEEAGEYTLQFFQLETSQDRANTIDNVVFACCNANAESGTVKVDEGATFEVNGMGDMSYNAFVMNGGTFQNASGTDVGSGTAQLKHMFVTSDSALNLRNNYGFIGNGYSRTVLDLGGHTLKVDLNTDGKLFFLYNTEVKNGVLDVISGGWLETGKDGVVATSATIRCAAAMRASSSVSVGNYTAYRASSRHNDGSAVFKVYDTFTPMTDVFYGCQMQDGSTIDLSGRENAWHTTTASDGNAKGSTTVTFADEAAITVNLHGREGLFALARSPNPFVVTWNEVPANFAGLKFEPDARSRKAGFKLVADAKMVPGDEGEVEAKGLRLVYLGGSVLFFR